MTKRYLVLVLMIAFAVSIAGCGAKNLVSKPVPPLDGYSSVLIAPYDIKKPTGKYNELPTMLAYGAGTKLSIRLKDKTWKYDQSREIKPVTDKMKELGLSQNEIYMKPESAVKLAKAFDANLIVVGQLKEPSYTIERSGKIEYEMAESTPSGAARYYAVYQSATLRINIKIIDVNSGDVIWNNDILGFKKYKTRYRTGENEKSMREDTMYADIRKDFIESFVNKLYPEVVPTAVKW